MAISTHAKRLYLRFFKNQADGSLAAKPLLNAIQTAAFSQLEKNNSGFLITGAAKNGESVNYSLPSYGTGITVRDLVDLFSQLLDLYDNCLADLISGGNATPTETQVYELMLSYLVRVTSLGVNFGATSYV